MSAAGLSATGSASAAVYMPGPSSSRRKSSVSAMTSHINRDLHHRFYIPGETPSGGHFPEPKKSLATTDVQDVSLQVTGASPPVHKNAALASWSVVRQKVWNLVNQTFKKETRLSQSDIFNEACALRLAAYNGSNRGRGRRQLDHLMKITEFTKNELKLLYWGWKCTCPNGILTEAAFKDIYSQFFPQAGDSSLYAHHVYRSMFGEKETSGVTFRDYVVSLSTLVHGDTIDKLEWTFKLYDINGDGQITLDEMEEISKAIYSLLGYYVFPEYDNKTSEVHAQKVFSKLDPQGTGAVTKSQFLEICSKDEQIVNSLHLLQTRGMEM